MTSFPTTHLHRVTMSCLSLPLIHGRNDLGDYTHKLRSLFHHCMFGMNRMNEYTFKILRQNVLTWWKILQSWNFHAFWWKICLSGKHVKRATCVNNIGKFWYKNFLTSEAGKLLKQEYLQWVSLYCDFVMYYGGRIWTYVQVFSAPTVDHLLY